MGYKSKDKQSSGLCRKHSSHSQINCKEKQLTTNSCQCPQRYDTSFSYKDLPPPAPPDGRADLWDLQFCRWWGWNWVRKRESVTGSAPREREPRKPCLASKSRDRIEEEVPTNDTCDSSPGPSRTKRASFSCEDPEVRQCQQAPLTAKEQFKAMCKCLLGKKNVPPGMVKLYNTPSSSMVAFTKHERKSYGNSEKYVEPPSTQEKHIKKCRKVECKEHRSKVKSCKKSSLVKESTTPASEQSVIDDTQYKSSYEQRCESSTEESIEYLTFRLQHMNKNDILCPCQNLHSLPKMQDQSIEVGMDEIEESQIQILRDTKETQTCFDSQKGKTREKFCGPSKENCPYSEKRIKVKGKKEKTICIMVCCCGSCQQNNKDPDKQNNVQPISNQKYVSLSMTKDGDMNTFLGGTSNYEAVDKLSTLPMTAPPLSTKKLSKFGKPSKNYPWMQNTESTATTTSPHNIEGWIDPSQDFYDWLNPNININNHDDSLKLPDLIDVIENVSYLKKIDTSDKSNTEDRILLDAVCDAILKEYDEKTCPLLSEFQTYGKNELNMSLKDLGVYCNLRNDDIDKSDVHTELSRVLVNTEDVGVQLSKALNLNSILERSDANRIDNIMSNIMDNIFAKSKDSIGNVSQNSNKSKDPNNFQHDCEYSWTDNSQDQFRFNAADLEITRPGLSRFRDSVAVRKAQKRGAISSQKEENSCKKKLKQEECWKNITTNSKIENIFCNIEDIILKSKAKTAEIQKVFNFVPKKQELSNRNSESVLQIHNLSQNCTKLDDPKQSSTDNTLIKNTLKRNYPMSSDTFKGTICEALTKHDVYGSIKKDCNPINDNISQTYCGVLPQSILEENGHHLFSETREEDSEGHEVDNKITDTPDILNQRLSKLSVQSFIVCDEKSKVESKASTVCSAGMQIGRKSLKNNCSKVSLIPVRRRSYTEC